MMASADTKQTSGAKVRHWCSWMANLDDLKGAGGGKDRMDSSCPTSPLPDLLTKPSPTVTETATSTSSSDETDSSLSCLSHNGDGDAERRVIRFADECGSKLVTKAVHSTYWWDDMVLGVDRCPNCGHLASREAIGDSITDATDVFSKNGRNQKSKVSVMELVPCESCGALFRTQPPGELFQFIAELSEGVEATLLEPTLMGKKRRKVLLYTDDNGETISWLETGSNRASKPLNIRCKTLLEVEDYTGLELRGTRGHQGCLPATSKDAISSSVIPTGQEQQHRQVASEAKIHKGNRKKLEVPNATSSKTEKAIEARSIEELPLEGGVYDRGCSYGGEADGAGNDGNACVETHDVRIKLRWRLNPKSSVKKVTIVDVRCSCPAIFARGMMRLQEHNTDLLE